jgi:hypothetical protein
MRGSYIARMLARTSIRRIGPLRGGLWVTALCAAAAALVIVVLPASGASTSVPKTALLDEASVTLNDGIVNEGQPVSLEQYAAEQAGYTVTVVSGAEWEAMSAAEFAQYQLLIVGDPICSDTAASAIESAETWAPVVMGTSGINPLVGNRAVVGTDPEFHYDAGGGGARPTNPEEPNTAGAEHLEQDAITYAGGVAGATGVYFDTSCADPNPTPEGEPPVPGGDLSVLERLTGGTSGEWVENPGPPCGGSVQQVAENPSFDSGPTTLTDENIQGWGCSDHVSFPHYPADWNALAVATDTPTHPTCGVDPDTKEEVCGQAYVLVAGKGIVAEAPNLSLAPTTHSDPAGGSHTVTATVIKEEEPVPGTVVSFLVTGQNAGVSGTCTTSSGEADPTCAADETGKVLFTYSDASGTGEDTINASITLEGTTEHATASEEWISVASEETPTTTETTPTTTTSTTATTATTASTPPAKGGVLAFGTAHLASSPACVASSGYVASVHGKDIASVTFKLDGHKLKTLKKANSHGAYTLRVAVKAGKVEHLSIHVKFTSATSNRSATITKRLARCAAVHHVTKPRFTG